MGDLHRLRLVEDFNWLRYYNGSSIEAPDWRAYRPNRPEQECFPCIGTVSAVPDEERARCQKLVRFDADLPEFRRLLAQSITPEKKRLAKGAWHRVAVPETASLSGLISNGFPAPATAPHFRMIQIAGPTSRNHRPPGTSPQPAEPTELAQLQKEHGDILVERKVLPPDGPVCRRRTHQPTLRSAVTASVDAADARRRTPELSGRVNRERIELRRHDQFGWSCQ